MRTLNYETDLCIVGGGLSGGRLGSAGASGMADGTGLVCLFAGDGGTFTGLCALFIVIPPIA